MESVADPAQNDMRNNVKVLKDCAQLLTCCIDNNLVNQLLVVKHHMWFAKTIYSLQKTSFRPRRKDTIDATLQLYRLLSIVFDGVASAKGAVVLDAEVKRSVISYCKNLVDLRAEGVDGTS